MAQSFEYRGVRYQIGQERGKRPEWAIYPDKGHSETVRQGVVVAVSREKPFRLAVLAAQRAIDEWLDGAAQRAVTSEWPGGDAGCDGC